MKHSVSRIVQAMRCATRGIGASSGAGAYIRGDAQWVGDIEPGAVFDRSSVKATRYLKAVEAFGAWLTTQSGFSRQVTLEYKFGGPEGKRHYICGGADGRESAATAGRVFSGAKR